jgi:hypothetical protein
VKRERARARVRVVFHPADPVCSPPPLPHSHTHTQKHTHSPGEFFGGCDILVEAYTKGELVEVVEAALAE